MEDDFAVTSRRPLEGLEVENDSIISNLSEKFDMFREVPSNMMRNAIAFAYLEHLVRMSTDISVAERSLSNLKGEIKDKIKTVLDARHEVLQEALHSLDSLINLSDLSGVTPHMMNINYKWTGTRISIEEMQYGDGSNLPIAYTFAYKGKYFLLYTPNMNYVDGYEPTSGQIKIPIISEGQLKLISKEFYMKVTTKAIQTESKSRGKTGKRGKAKTGPVESQAKDEEPKTISFLGNILSQTRAEEPEMEEDDHPALLHTESEAKHTESDSNSESPKEESDSFNYDNPPKKLPSERTWEKFQKRAQEQQKERDQCGPGDCRVL